MAFSLLTKVQSQLKWELYLIDTISVRNQTISRTLCVEPPPAPPWISLPSHISTPSFYTSHISTPSFCTFHISPPSFLGFDCMMPFCTTCSTCYPLGRGVLGQEGREVHGHCAYWVASVALDPSPRSWAIVWGRSYLGRDDPDQFPLVGPGSTRPYTNTSPLGS